MSSASNWSPYTLAWIDIAGKIWHFMCTASPRIWGQDEISFCYKLGKQKLVKVAFGCNCGMSLWTFELFNQQPHSNTACMKHGTSAFLSTAKAVKLSEKSDTESLLPLYGGEREWEFPFIFILILDELCQRARWCWSSLWAASANDHMEHPASGNRQVWKVVLWADNQTVSLLLDTRHLPFKACINPLHTLQKIFCPDCKATLPV